MADYEVVEQSRLREVAEWLAGWKWPLTEADSISRAADFGWTVIDENPGKGEVFETGLLRARSWAVSYVGDGEVYRLSVFTSPVVDDSEPRGRAYVTDVFASQIQMMTAIVGEPFERVPGVDGSASWQLPSGGLLRVGRTGASCSWSVESPDFAQLLSDVGQYEDSERQD